MSCKLVRKSQSGEGGEGGGEWGWGWGKRKVCDSCITLELGHVDVLPVVGAGAGQPHALLEGVQVVQEA